MARSGDVRHVVRTIKQFDERGPRRLAWIGLCGFVTGLAEAVVLAAITTVAVGAAGDSSGRSIGPIDVGAGQGLAIACAALLVCTVSGYFMARSSSVLVADGGLAARQRLLVAFYRASFAQRSSNRVAALQERLTTYVDRFGIASLGVVTLISSALSLASFALTALVIDAKALAGLALVGVLVVAVHRPISVRSRAASKELGRLRAQYAEGATESVLLAREIAVFGVGGVVSHRMRRADRKVATQVARARFLGQINTRIYQSIALGIVIGALAVLGGASGSRLAGVAAVALILLRSLSYGQAVLGNLQTLSEQRPFLDELARVIDEYEGSASHRGTTPIGPLDRLELESVSFGYGVGDPVLHDVDLVVKATETIGVVGPSGAGKTTLVNLLLRLYEPSEGVVTANGIPLDEVDDDAWHRQTAIVPQEPRLIQGTVADNIRFMRDISDDAVRDAAAQANIDAFVRSLPEEYNAPVRELGQNLSGGQRQRLCIARALAGGPDLLVLDEPTSALDGESEAAIQATLRELKGRVAMVLVAHRLSTLSICDRIVVVDHGRIVADGSPSELRTTSTYFREAMQQAGL